MTSSIRVKVLCAVAAAALSTAPALAQIGPWGQEHPAWVDTNGNGRVDPGELGPYPELILPQSGPAYIQLADNPWACTGAQSQFFFDQLIPSPTSGSAHVVRTVGSEIRTNDTAVEFFSATEFSWTQTLSSAPVPPARRPGVRPLAATSDGSGALTGPPGGPYTGFTLNQTGGFSVDVPFQYVDVTGDGKADYIGYPWALQNNGVKKNPCVPGGTAGLDPQVYLPLADSNGDGKPDTVQVVPLGGPGVTTGPPLVPAAAANGFEVVPTLSSWGIFALTAALAGWGWLQLRGRLTAGV